MHRKLLNILGCPYCRISLDCRELGAGDEIEAGKLECRQCRRVFPIEHGIPRFTRHTYADSFGLQWNEFSRLQLDSRSGTRLSRSRLESEIPADFRWRPGFVLDAGCGAGRFLECAADFSDDLIGLDISSAVDAARENLRTKKNVHLVQGSILEPPFRRNVFSAAYSIGVLQHTPDPLQAAACIVELVEPGGTVAITVYERHTWTTLNGKYIARHVTRRLPPRALLLAIRSVMPAAFSITELLFRLPVIGKLFRFAIPIANYVDEPALSLRQRYSWAILDTFDMLSPRYDAPQTHERLRAALVAAGLTNISRQNCPGLTLTGSVRS